MARPAGFVVAMLASSAHSSVSSRRPRAGVRPLVGSIAVAVALSLAVCAGDARPAKSDTVTLSMLANFTHQSGWEVMIPNFERVYPNITVNVTYAPTSAALDQLEATEFAAGNAPELVETSPGCGTPISVCTLAKAGYLAPMIKEPWLKRSLPSVISASKYGQGLFAFEPAIAPFVIVTNDTLFKQLGLAVPQTFAQLLDVCRKAQADGTAAVILQGASGVNVAGLIVGLAVATVYGKDKHWAGELRAGKNLPLSAFSWPHAAQTRIAPRYAADNSGTSRSRTACGGQVNAAMPVRAWPTISVCISCVPS